MLFLFPAKNRHVGYSRSAPIDNTTSVNGANVDQPQSFSCNVETTEVSDESPNIYLTPNHQQQHHASLFANDFSSAKKRLQSISDSQTKKYSSLNCAYCCCKQQQHKSPQQKIDNNHKPFISSAEQDQLDYSLPPPSPPPPQQQQQCVHYLNVIGEQKQSKRKNRQQPSPTHFHRIECTLNVKKSSENLSTVPTSCHSRQNRSDLITVDHRFNGDAIHATHTNQSLWIDVNCTKSNEFNQVNGCAGDECCCYCQCGDCRRKWHGRKASANSSVNSDPSARTNNNCKSFKNQNNEPNSCCQCDTKDILDIAARKCLFRENFYVQKVANNINNKCIAKLPKRIAERNVKNKQSAKLNYNNNNNNHSNSYSRQTHALRTDDCSDCINCLDKQFIKQIKRFQTTEHFAPVCIESVPFARKEQQKKLVCCTQNVTAVRNTATVFMVGDDRSNLVGLKLNQHDDKSESLVRNGVVFTYQNTALNNHSSNNNNHNGHDVGVDDDYDDDEFNNKCVDSSAKRCKNIDQTCESHKSIGSVSSTNRKLTSILSAKESHSKVFDHNRVKSVEVDLNFIDDDGDEATETAVESVQNNDRSTKSDNASGDENNSEIAQNLCHLEKLNLADATAATTTIVSGPNEIHQNITHISLTQRDNNKNDDNGGATTTQTRTATAAHAASTTLLENEWSAIDETPKQSQHKNVNCTVSTEQSATPLLKDNHSSEAIERNEQTVHVNDFNRINEHDKCNCEHITGKSEEKANNLDNHLNRKLFFDDNTVLSENGVNSLNDECIVFEYKPILPPTNTNTDTTTVIPSSLPPTSSFASNCNHPLNRRTSFDGIIDNKSPNCGNHHQHRRTNSVGDEPNTTFSQRQSKYSTRGFVESISDRFRFVQNTDYRYAYLMPNFVSFANIFPGQFLLFYELRILFR